MQMITITEDQLNIYLSLFRGRVDIYARYWEKNGKSGYSPAYDVDWTEFNKHKLSGGSFKDFKNKKPIPFTQDIVKKHLLGSYCTGIYPILPDNTSYFIAADFDETTWMEDCKKLIEACKGVGLTAYLERSRSGNGGHVWLFFESLIPCSHSRFILNEVIRKAFKYSEFEKEISFDRR